MKKLILNFIVLGFILGCPLILKRYVFAEEMNVRYTKRVSGRIASVNNNEKEIVLKEKGGDITYKLDKNASVRAGEKTTLNDLKIGDKVTLYYRIENNENIATEIK